MIFKFLIKKKRRLQIKYFDYRKDFYISETYIRLNSIENIFDYRSDLELGNNLKAQGKHDEAELLLQRISKLCNIDPDNNSFKGFSTFAKYALAMNEHNRLNVDKAIKYIKSIQYYPDVSSYININTLLAQLYGHIGNHKEALKTYDLILDVDYKAIFRIYSDYFKTAELTYEGFSAEDFIKKNYSLENEYYSLLALAKYFSDKTESGKAMEYLKKINIDTNEVYETKAAIYYYEGRYQLSKENYFKAWRKSKKKIDYLGMWVIAYLNQNDGALASALTNLLVKTPVAKRNPVMYRKLVMIGRDVEEVFNSYRYTEGVKGLQAFLPDKLLNTLLDEKLSDSSLLVLPMWGIGDEIMIAGIYGEIQKILDARHVNLTIATEQRLFGLLQRSFPSIKFKVINRKHRGPHVNKLSSVEGSKERLLPSQNLYYTFDYESWSEIKNYEYVIPAPFVAQTFVRQGMGVKGDGAFLIPKTSLKETFKQRLNACSGKPKVGISWRSGFTSNSRAIYYSSLNQWAEIFQYKDKVDFVNLQYDNSDDEIAQAKQDFGVDIINFNDIDMFNDLESVAALIASMDITIAPCTVVGDLAGALGVPTLYLINSPEGNWRYTDNSNIDRWFKAIEFIRPIKYGDVDSLLSNAAAALQKRISDL